MLIVKQQLDFFSFFNYYFILL